MTINKIRRFALAGVSLALVLCFSVRTAEAVTGALSINFTSGSYASVGNNTAGVDAYGNWNDMLSTSTFAALDSLKLSNGATATGVKVDGFAQYDIYNSLPATAGGSTGDQALMQAGPRQNFSASGSIFVSSAIQISGLSNIFSSYEVRSYQSYLDQFQSPTHTGGMYVSSDTADFSLNHLGGTPSQYNTAGVVGSATWGPQNITAFSGNFATNGFYAVTGNIASAPDTIVVTQYNGSSSTQFSGSNWNGLQIVGELKAVPEPSTFALAGIGLMGLVGFGLRRRKK